MGSAEILRGVLEAAIATGAAVAMLLLLRSPLRRVFGPSIGYAAWWLVPVCLLAVLLPAPRMVAGHAASVQLLPGTGVTFEAASPAGMSPLDLWLVIWLLGAALLACRFAMQQRAFRIGLGALRRRDDGCEQAESQVGLPAAMGLLRPRVVVPSDFDSRYSSEQRELMRQHERIHIRRGDLHVNAGVALLRCLFWFNPLMHIAARHFRHDQELACDAAVVARHPQHRRAYGEAMLHTQIASQPLPLGCHWGFSHPLKERIEMLKHTPRSTKRTAVGSVLVGILVAGAGMAAWAAQPGRPATTASAAPESVAMALALDAPRYPAELAQAGVSGKVVLLVDIDATGTPTHVEVETAEPEGVFDAAAIDAAYKWRFNPEVRNGKPVASRTRVPIHFDANGNPPEEAAAGGKGVAPVALETISVQR